MNRSRSNVVPLKGCLAAIFHRLLPICEQKWPTLVSEDMGMYASKAMDVAPCRPEIKRLHSLQDACSSNLESDWGAVASCHLDCDLASLMDMLNASPVADNAGEIPPRFPATLGVC